MMSLAMQINFVLGILSTISGQQAQADASFCQHVSRDNCSDNYIKTSCPKKCHGPVRACGSFSAVSHLGSTLHDNRNSFSPLIDNGGTASLHTSATDLGFSTHRCGASLISDRYLLTAAHCLEGNERLVSISLGREDLNQNPSPGRDTYIIQESYIHPDYDSSKHEYNDLAILKTDRKVQFSDNVWPFCLPESNQVFTDYTVMNIAGWGHVNQSHKSSSIKAAFVNLIGASRCESSWQEHSPNQYDIIRRVTYPQGFTKQILCAGREGVDACQGDSGGPMSHQNSDGHRIVVGLIAKRTDCPDLPITPGFYINVAYYTDWINGIITQSAPPPHPTVTKPLGPMTATQRKAIFPSKEECGKSLSNNVVLGKKTSPGAWPWLAAIGVKTASQFVPYCGGTLITKQHVISAAHCFAPPRDNTIVRLGEYDVTRSNTKAQDFNIVDNRIGAWDKQKKKDDIILLKLDRPLDSFTDTIRAACLPYHLRNDGFEGKKLIVVGWGRLSNKNTDTSPVPLQGRVPVVPIQDCQERYKNGTFNIDDKQLCAGKGGTDSCTGDSGGPLNYLDLQEGRFYLAGVVSFGPNNCGDNHLPGVYTRIGYYLDWIEENISQLL